MDVVSLFSPPSSKGYRFILGITDYFSKWIETILLKEVKTSDVIKFIKYDVITALACHNGSSTITGLSSSAKHSRNSTTSSEFKACLKITEDKSSDNRVHASNARLIKATRAMPKRRAQSMCPSTPPMLRCRARSPRLNATLVLRHKT